MPKRAHIEVRCSNCDRVLGTFPERSRLNTDLVCPQCGATVKAPGVIAKTVGGIKEVIDELTGRDERSSSE